MQIVKMENMVLNLFLKFELLLLNLAEQEINMQIHKVFVERQIVVGDLINLLLILETRLKRAIQEKMQRLLN